MSIIIGGRKRIVSHDRDGPEQVERLSNYVINRIENEIIRDISIGIRSFRLPYAEMRGGSAINHAEFANSIHYQHEYHNTSLLSEAPETLRVSP